MSNAVTRGGPDSRKPPEQLIIHAQERTNAFVAKLKKAMDVIEKEIESHDGLYPYNGGRLSQSELCRRAAVTNVALQSAGHKNTTLTWVKNWLVRVHLGLTTGKKSVRKKVTDRAESWKDQHAALATAYNIAMIKFGELETRVRELEAKNAELRHQLAMCRSSKIAHISKKPK